MLIPLYLGLVCNLCSADADLISPQIQPTVVTTTAANNITNHQPLILEQQIASLSQDLAEELNPNEDIAREEYKAIEYTKISADTDIFDWSFVQENNDESLNKQFLDIELNASSLSSELIQEFNLNESAELSEPQVVETVIKPTTDATENETVDLIDLAVAEQNIESIHTEATPKSSLQILADSKTSEYEPVEYKKLSADTSTLDWSFARDNSKPLTGQSLNTKLNASSLSSESTQEFNLAENAESSEPQAVETVTTSTTDTTENETVNLAVAEQNIESVHTEATPKSSLQLVADAETSEYEPIEYKKLSADTSILDWSFVRDNSKPLTVQSLNTEPEASSFSSELTQESNLAENAELSESQAVETVTTLTTDATENETVDLAVAEQNIESVNTEATLKSSLQTVEDSHVTEDSIEYGTISADTNIFDWSFVEENSESLAVKSLDTEPEASSLSSELIQELNLNENGEPSESQAVATSDNKPKDLTIAQANIEPVSIENTVLPLEPGHDSNTDELSVSLRENWQISHDLSLSLNPHFTHSGFREGFTLLFEYRL